MEATTVIEDHEHYSIVASEDQQSLVFNWKFVKGLGAEGFAAGIEQFAFQCKTHRPARAVIDARSLDPASPAMGWLRSQLVVEGLEPYEPWWANAVLPIYHEARISGLGIATGDPDAPGEVGTQPGVNFKMGYFTDVDAVLSWPVQ